MEHTHALSSPVHTHVQVYVCTRVVYTTYMYMYTCVYHESYIHATGHMLTPSLVPRPYWGGGGGGGK